MLGVSLIVTCFHSNEQLYGLTQRCISHLKKNTDVPFKFILVENLQRWAADEGDVYASFNYPRSWAMNANTGLSLVGNSEYIGMLNNDVFVPEGWFEAILECFKDPQCGVATLDSTQYHRPPQDEIIEQFFGSIWVARREVIQKVGFFDENFVHAFDDADYWVRVYQAGYKILMNRALQVVHEGGSTLYQFDGHTEQYVAMRKRFNEKHKDCGLPIFERLR